MSKLSSPATAPISSTAYRNFIETCRSPATRLEYSKGLRYFMSFLRLGPEDYDNLLDKDHKTIQMDICDFVTFMKKEHSSATVTLYLAALNKFFSMNDITTLNWKKIHSFEAEREKSTEDRPYTHSEIQLLLQKTTPRNRAIILLMCSAGLRVGALALRIRDLEPMTNMVFTRLMSMPVQKNHVTFRFVR
jgi:site-specific recombinase XerD